MILFNRNPKGALSDRKKVAIFGTSNSLMKFGWVDGLKSHLGKEWEIFNFSLGACSSIFIAYQIQENLDILKKFDLIIIEPIVNDISFYANKQVSFDLIRHAVESLCHDLRDVGIPVLYLLFPAQKRVAGIATDRVYNLHKNLAFGSGFCVIDLFSAIKNYEPVFEDLFLDPGHIDIRLAYYIGRMIAINHAAFFDINDKVISSKPQKYYFQYVTVKQLGCDFIEEKSTELFSAEVGSRYLGWNYDIPKGFELAGISHWNDRDDCKVDLKSTSGSESLDLKGRYAKVTSPTSMHTGNLIIEPSAFHESLKLIGLIFVEEGCILNDIDLGSPNPALVSDDSIQSLLENIIFKYTIFYVGFSSNLKSSWLYKSKSLKKRDSIEDFIRYQDFLLSCSVCQARTEKLEIEYNDISSLIYREIFS